MFRRLRDAVVQYPTLTTIFPKGARIQPVDHGCYAAGMMFGRMARKYRI
jgi:hypothetical protein